MKNACPVCKSLSHHRIGIPQIGEKASQIVKKEYLVVQCNNCQFYFLDPKVDLSQEEWEYLYNEEYFSQSTNWHLKKRNSDRKKRFDKLRSYSSLQIVKFLDIGCGEGYALLEAHKRGWESYGIDIFDNRIEEVKNTNSIFIKSDLFNAFFPDNSFDIIYLDSVLEHVINPLEYLSEIKRILKKGGLVYIGVPNEDSLLNEMRKYYFRISSKKDISEKIKPFQTPFHVGGFNSSSLDYLIKTVGLKIRGKRNFACRMEFLKYSFLSRDYLVGLLLLPLYLIAIPLKREAYFELYLEKK
jgi:SAM-dependent methyltransferase